MSSTIIYARVSTAEQDLDHQTDNLWSYAVHELELDPVECYVLEDESTGTRGGSLHAEGHFERAIEELEAIPDFEEES